MNNREKLTSYSASASAVALTDLALRYFPRSTKRSASEQLRRWMRLNPDLQRRLAELHFQPRQRVLTPLQHEAVLRYLGGTLIE